jgi:hypothetical protein
MLSSKPDLLKNLCVEQDEKVGIYGFVFHRDGKWFSEIVDDTLFLRKEDYDAVDPAQDQERMLW